MALDDFIEFDDLEDGLESSFGDELNARFDATKAAGNQALRFQLAWDATVPYKLNAVVWFANSYWHALSVNTNSQPATGNANWRKLGGDVSSATVAALGTVKLNQAPIDAANPVVVGANAGVGGVLGGSLLAPSFAVDMATQAELNGVALLKADVIHSHNASDISDFDQKARESMEYATGAPVQSLADLRAVAPARRQDKQTRYVEDTGALYDFNAEGTGADDGDGTIAPTTGTGRWFKTSGAGSSNAATLGGNDGSFYRDRANHIGVGAVAFVGDTAPALIVEGTLWLDTDEPATVASGGSPSTNTYLKTEADGLFRRIDTAVAFPDLADKPTTIVGYGITDAVSAAQFADFIGASTPAALDTLHEIVAQLQSDETAFGQLSNALSAHTSNTSNPHLLTKNHIGLGNVDNTSDALKPVSDATQAALNGKLSASSVESGGRLLLPQETIPVSLVANVGPASANQVVWGRFFVGRRINVSKLAVWITTASAGQTFAVGIYDLTGNRLTTTGAQSAAAISPSAIGGTLVTLSSNLQLEPGNYYFAYTVSDAIAKIAGLSLSAYFSLLGASTADKRAVGVSANSAVAGDLPTTLGALSGANSTTGFPFIALIAA